MKILIFIFMSLFSLTGFSQTQVSDINFNTGFIANSNDVFIDNFIFDELGDSLLYLDYSRKISGNFVGERRRVVIDKSTFSVISNTKVYDAKDAKYYRDSTNGPSTEIHKYIHDDKNNVVFYNQYFLDTNAHANFAFYSIDQNYNKDTLLFSLQDSISVLPLSIPFVYDSIFYFYGNNFFGDTAYIKSYDLNGNLLQQNSFYKDAGNDSYEFPRYFDFLGPTAIFPPNDSFLIFQKRKEPQLRLVNRFTLNIAKKIFIPKAQMVNLMNTIGWSNMYGEEYRFFPTYFRVGSSLVHFPFFNSPNPSPVLDFNFYYIDLDYKGNILRTKEYGNDTVYSRSFSFDIFNDVHFVAGSQPFRYVQSYAQEYRQILIYKDSVNTIDSLFLYGNKNHIAMETYVDNNGDIFIMSI